MKYVLFCHLSAGAVVRHGGRVTHALSLTEQVQNKKSKKLLKNFLTHLVLYCIIMVAHRPLPIIQPYKSYKMSLREKSKIVCTSSMYTISVPKIDSHNGFFYCLFLAYLSVLKKG